jgi:hypothetical protein
MQPWLTVSALILPLFVIPVWLAVAGAQASRRYAMARRS